MHSIERPTRKADIIQLIVLHMTSSKAQVTWKQLKGVDQKAIAEAIHHWDGTMKLNRFRNKYQALPELFASGKKSYGIQNEHGSDPLLLFFYKGSIPSEFKENLLSFVPKPEDDCVKTCPEESIPKKLENFRSSRETFSMQIRCMEDAIIHELPALLRLINLGKISVSDKTGKASASSIQLIEEVLFGGDYFSLADDKNLNSDEGGLIRPIRAFAWPLILQSSGLAKCKGTKLELTRNGISVLENYNPKIIGTTIINIYNSWLQKGAIDEFRRIDLIKGQQSKRNQITDVVMRRISIEEALMECPIGKWVSVNEFFRYIQSTGIDLTITEDPWRLYLAEPEHGSLGYEGCHNFEILEGRYILVYLFEYLATLGMIDIAYTAPYQMRNDFNNLWGSFNLSFLSRYDGLHYFRLNSLGAYCVRLTKSYQPVELPVIPLLNIDEQLKVKLLREPEPGEQVFLDQYFAKEQNAFRILDSEFLFTALEQGLKLEPLLQFLEKFSNEPLNTNVKEFFAEFSNRKAAFSDAGSARLFKCSSISLARMISTNPLTEKYCQLVIGKSENDMILVVPKKSEAAFRTSLKKLGYILPKT